jgi:uncharacterized MAPEG superfamily protein
LTQLLNFDVMTFLQSLPISTTLLYCIAIAAILIYVPFLVVAYGRVQAGNDIAAPRALFDKLPAFAKRATWAHQNSFESFTLFAPAALMALVTQANSALVAGAAIAYVSARLFYSVFYILNVPVLRLLMFAIGTASIATLMTMSIMAVR